MAIFESNLTLYQEKLNLEKEKNSLKYQEILQRERLEHERTSALIEKEKISGMNSLDLGRQKQFFDILNKNDEFIQSRLQELQQKNINWDNAIANGIMKIFELEAQNIMNEKQHSRNMEFETHKHNLKMSEKNAISEDDVRKILQDRQSYSPDDDYWFCKDLAKVNVNFVCSYLILQKI